MNGSAPKLAETAPQHANPTATADERNSDEAQPRSSNAVRQDREAGRILHGWGVDQEGPAEEGADAGGNEDLGDEQREDYEDALFAHRMRRRVVQPEEVDKVGVVKDFVKTLFAMPARHRPEYRRQFAAFERLLRHWRRIRSQMSAEIRPTREEEFMKELIYHVQGNMAPIVRLEFVAAYGLDFARMYRLVMVHHRQRFELVIDLRNPQLLGPKLNPVKLSVFKKIFAILFYEDRVSREMLIDDIAFDVVTLLKKPFTRLDFSPSGISIKIRADLVPDHERSLD